MWGDDFTRRKKLMTKKDFIARLVLQMLEQEPHAITDRVMVTVFIEDAVKLVENIDRTHESFFDHEPIKKEFRSNSDIDRLVQDQDSSSMLPIPPDTASTLYHDEFPRTGPR